MCGVITLTTTPMIAKSLVALGFSMIAIGFIKLVAYGIQLFFDSAYLSVKEKNRIKEQKESGVFILLIGAVSSIIGMLIHNLI